MDAAKEQFSSRKPPGGTGWHQIAWKLRLPAVVAVIAAALFLLPGRERIAPEVAGDNAYIFQAADRLYAGLGATCVPPQAPLQPWTWTADFTWLTQWPVGYPVLLCAARWSLGITSVQAGQVLAVLACAFALVGWYAWLRRVLPEGAAAALISAVAAACSVSVAMLVSPATDTIVVAALPWILLAVCPATDSRSGETGIGAASGPTNRGALAFAIVGIAASALIWIRYAAVFVPMGIGLFLLVERLRRRICLRSVAAFTAGAFLPLVTLVLLNQALSHGAGVQEQLNLGSRIGFDFSPRLLATAWSLWTELPFYNHKSINRPFFSFVVPVAVLALTLSRPGVRAALAGFLRRPPVVLSAAVVIALFALLITCTSLFKSKYDYIGLERYYRPIKPLYFALLVGPILAIRWKPVRASTAAAMLLALAWMVQVEWPRPYQRWLAAERPFTEYGRWEHAFGPHSVAVFDWLREQAGPDLVVFSNFHDEIALETWIPAVPLPDSRETMNKWLASIRGARGLEALRVCFVIDSEYHNREYFLPSLQQVVMGIGLRQASAVPEELRPFAWVPSEPQQIAWLIPD